MYHYISLLDITHNHPYHNSTVVQINTRYIRKRNEVIKLKKMKKKKVVNKIHIILYKKQKLKKEEISIYKPLLFHRYLADSHYILRFCKDN
jgi:hypothetical protein